MFRLTRSQYGRKTTQETHNVNITVIGSGYVGLVTGTCLAALGHRVVCLDADDAKIAQLNKGVIPIYETGLKELVDKHSNTGALHFTSDTSMAIHWGDVLYVAVGTPSDENGDADLQHVLRVANSIGEHMSSFKVVINKSTVPVGTAKRVSARISHAMRKRGYKSPSQFFSVVSNPEFLREGSAIGDFMKPDRVVIGHDESTGGIRARDLLKEIYSPLALRDEQILFMDTASAELTKYAANAMLATRISFMNELSLLAEKSGADIECIRKGIGSDRRIGHSFLQAGIGYGGSCFPKDTLALRRTARQHGMSMTILDAVDEANTRQKLVLTQRLTTLFGRNLRGHTIALWGLTFKPDTDDMREAPSLVIIRQLLNLGANLQLFDPVGMSAARPLVESILKDSGRGSVSFMDSAFEAACGADALLLVTEWSVFRSPDFRRLRDCMRQPVILDGRNALDAEAARRHQFFYYGIGRPILKPENHPFLDITLPRMAEAPTVPMQAVATPVF
jgi:UDPglucose 6-dehydrogenase